MLVPENKELKEQVYLERFASWLDSRSEDERPYFCQHGRYIGYKGALAFCCPGCMEQTVN